MHDGSQRGNIEKSPDMVMVLLRKDKGRRINHLDHDIKSGNTSSIGANLQNWF